MTSDDSWSNKLRVISDLERPDHWFLDESDECYFLGNYTPGEKYNFSAVNQLIFNLKMPVAARHEFRYRYKRQAISRSGATIGAAVNHQLAQVSAIIPIPPSKPPGHPEYDDRTALIARAAKPFETREILSTAAAREAAHLAKDKKRSVEAIYQNLNCHPEQNDGRRVAILVDDVLTTGASFKACKRKLVETQMFERIFGVFVARCAWPKAELPALEF